MKNISFILFLLIISSAKIICFDDMIALLPSLRTSTNKKSFLKIDPIKTNQTNSSGINDHFNYSYYNCQQIEAIMKIDNEIRDEINQIKSELMNKSLEIEQKIQNEKNSTVKENHKKDLEDIMTHDISIVKRIEKIWKDLVNSSLIEKNRLCKAGALNKLEVTKTEIRSFIQTMKIVAGKLQVKCDLTDF